MTNINKPTLWYKTKGVNGALFSSRTSVVAALRGCNLRQGRGA